MKEQLRPSEEEAKEPIPKDNESWIRTSSFIACNILNKDRSPLPKRAPSFPQDCQWLIDHYQILRMGSRLQPKSSKRFEGFYKRRRRSLLNLAETISKEKDYSHLIHLWQQGAEVFREMTFNALDTDIATVYYLLCPPGRFLASVKGGPHWKNIDPQKYSPEELGILWENISFDMIAPLQFLEPKDIDMIPDRFIPKTEQNSIQIPEPIKSVEELLEEAHYGQRYIVPPEGAVVHLQKAGDLQSLTIKVQDGYVMAKGKFNQGEAMGIIVLDSALKISPSLHFYWKNPKFRRFPRIIAEVYRDLVTAVEIPVLNRERREKPDVQIEPTDREYTYVYIPRTIRVRERREKEERFDLRLPYEGPKRPIRPHQVIGHVRNVPMTPEHRKVLEKFEKETSIDVLKFVPKGHTFVRPHISPTITPELLDRLPQFIKRRIETDLQESIREQVTKNEPTVVYQSS